MTKLTILSIFLMSVTSRLIGQDITGAWEHKENTLVDTYIYASGFFSVARYNTESKEFVSTYGGKFSVKEGKLTETVEFDTQAPDRIGTEAVHALTVGKGLTSMKLDNAALNRVDDGKPGDLAGAWLITGRVNDKGEVRRSTPGARRTMKILSGTRFQCRYRRRQLHYH